MIMTKWHLKSLAKVYLNVNEPHGFGQEEKKKVVSSVYFLTKPVSNVRLMRKCFKNLFLRFDQTRFGSK